LPELPEVETTVRETAPHINGRRITGVALPWEGIVRESTLAEFRSGLIGETVTGITRRGKYIFWHLSGGKVLNLHLKMSGSLLLKPSSAEAGKFTRAIFYFDNDTAIHFRDPRKFGVLRLLDRPGKVTGRLGPEPLEGGFTREFLERSLARRKAPIKAVIIDQNFIAGIGSMYADEALFAAGINPQRHPGSLTPEEIKHLHRAIRQVLRSGIEHMGASTSTYFRPGGEAGFAHHHFKVAHQRGKPCPVCGTPLEYIKLRGRGTCFCPRCQPLK